VSEVWVGEAREWVRRVGEMSAWVKSSECVGEVSAVRVGEWVGG
jgi:hypothetical protein